MFALIKTNGATDIAIFVPHDHATSSLPMLARMLETNAVFIQAGYQELKTVTPQMHISLGNQARWESYGQELALTVPESGAVLDESFVVAAPAVMASHRKGLQEKDKEIERLRTELSFVKTQLQRAEAELETALSREAA